MEYDFNKLKLNYIHIITADKTYKAAVIIFADGWQMPDEKGGK
ncbi:hypothetical protein MBCUT_03800 [Methanobrevibacter cuticularis]|uniref:Uncharacterized protein n=1 Tax=Methanobrevibacter cuticularis TaxID=47311 RepID=A0A166EYQ5_9EURY|nr:hypothetical protein [Methanobrevibacter cuticularis]KZX17148.1 hypothetical protein MBCUT_03800 [Methanobrevibacter cuticularis]